MRFLVIIKANEKSERGEMPPPELFSAMNDFNEEMVKAGMMLGGEGLYPSSKGKRLHFSGSGKVTVTDGPFAETKELVAGFWIIKAKSMEEMVQWMKRCPTTPDGGTIEIRPIYELEDIPADALPPEEAERERRMREQIEGKKV